MNSVAWREGQPLFAEHFYACAQFQREGVRLWLRCLQPGAEGFGDFRLDADWLCGNVAIRQLEMVLPTGDVLTRDELAGGARLELPTEWGTELLWVGVQRVAPVLLERMMENPVVDGLSRPVEQMNMRWRMAVHEKNVRDGAIPLLALLYRGGRWELAPTWLPPVLRANGHPAWVLRLDEIRKRLQDISSDAGVNRLLRIWNSLLDRHPAWLHLELQAALGFAAEYDHFRPLLWLDEVSCLLRDMGKDKPKRRERELGFASLGNGMHMVSLAGMPLQGSGKLLLTVSSVSGGNGPDEGDVRLAALPRLPRLLRMALPGIAMSRLPMENGTGNACFVLERSGELWEECLVEQVLGLHCTRLDVDWKFVIRMEDVYA